MSSESEAYTAAKYFVSLLRIPYMSVSYKDSKLPNTCIRLAFVCGLQIQRH